MNSHDLTVVKVGGSLFDLPDLGSRLRRWLERLDVAALLLVPGGGASVDVVRIWDRQHELGEELAHWLALRAVSVNARLLADLLPGAEIVEDVTASPAGMTILDAYSFARADEGRPGFLPHSWDVTSDALAARAAVVAGAQRLVLLKSVDIPEGMDWHQAGECGLVDRYFWRVLRGVAFRVQAVNLRTWRS